MHIVGSFWDSEKSIGGLVTFLDYAGFVDFVAGVVLLVIWYKKPKKTQERKLTLVAIILSLLAAVLWVADSKLSHRLTALQLVAQSTPKPLDERLRAFFDSVDPIILNALKHGIANIDANLNSLQTVELRNFGKEPGVGRYITSVTPKFSGMTPMGEMNTVTLNLSTNLIKSPPPQP